MSDVVSQHAGANSDTGQNDFDAIVVGAGIAGMYQLYRLRNLGLKVRIFDGAFMLGADADTKSRHVIHEEISKMLGSHHDERLCAAGQYILECIRSPWR